MNVKLSCFYWCFMRMWCSFKTVFHSFSLHIRSMWETICDAQAGFCTLTSNSNFLSKFSREPLSGISDQRVPIPTPSPTPENWNLGRSWHFQYLTPEYPPPRNQGYRMWRLISVSPVDTISFTVVMQKPKYLWQAISKNVHISDRCEHYVSGIDLHFRIRPVPLK